MIVFHCRRAAPEVRLCCFPHGGGEARIFRTWQQQLPLGVEVIPLEYPGHGTRAAEPLIEHLFELAEAAARALSAFADRPLILFGHSMGALVAFETAKRLQQQGTAGVILLIAAACRAPSRIGPIPALRIADRDLFYEELARYYGASFEAFRHLELKEFYLPILRNDFRLYESYQYRNVPRLQCPIAALGGRGDPSVSEEDLLQWRTMTEASFAVHWLPGGHFFVHEQRVVQQLAALLSEQQQTASCSPPGAGK